MLNEAVCCLTLHPEKINERFNMNRLDVFTALLMIIVVLPTIHAFSTRSFLVTRNNKVSDIEKIAIFRTYGFLGDQERDKLTRDSEPQDYFQT
jgi:hypothetical protein